MIRILLVDDHASTREPLALVLDVEQDMSVVAEAGSLSETREILPGLDVDIAVVDLHLPDGSGIDLIRDLRSVNPEASIIVLTASQDQMEHIQAYEAGAAGVLNKVAPISAITDAIRRLSAGEQLISPAELLVLLRLASERREQDQRISRAFDQLSTREHEVLQALADGLSDKDIADRLSISSKTVRNHMVSILGKLGVDSRLQVLVLAIRYGVVSLEKN